jgi:hypothetical protein
MVSRTSNKTPTKPGGHQLQILNHTHSDGLIKGIKNRSSNCIHCVCVQNSSTLTGVRTFLFLLYRWQSMAMAILSSSSISSLVNIAPDELRNTDRGMRGDHKPLFSYSKSNSLLSANFIRRLSDISLERN